MLDKRKTQIKHGCIHAKPVTSGSGRGVLIPHSALFQRQSRVPNFSHPEYRFLFHYRIPYKILANLASWVRGQIPYLVKKYAFSRIPHCIWSKPGCRKYLIDPATSTLITLRVNAVPLKRNQKKADKNYKAKPDFRLITLLYTIKLNGHINRDII